MIFRTQILNGFTLLSGDFTYDTIIHTSILEHWFNFFKGNQKWSEVGYFYPYKNTIANTDAYFLIGIIYSLFRILNIDPFLSTEFSNIILKAIGFIGAFLISKKFVNKFWPSLLVAVLFTLNNASTIHIYRVQLNSVAFVPFIGILLYNIFNAIKRGQKNAIFINLFFLGLLLGSLAMTSFYITFFVIIFLLILFILFTISNFKTLINFLRVNSRYIIYGFITIFIFFTPFIYVFLPKSFETGTKPYPYWALIDIPGLVQMGNSNLIWGNWYTKNLNKLIPSYEVEYYSEYYNMGFSPLVLLILCISLFWLYKNREVYSFKFFLIIAFASIISLFLIVEINNFSLWSIVYKFFFGAKALTVVSVFTIVLALPILIVISFFLSKSKRNFFTVFLIPFLLIILELNISVYKLNRIEELRKYQGFKSPNIKCNSFFVGGWEGQEVFGNYWEWINNQYAHNVSAMYISQKLNIPTINGMASFIPKTYNLVGPNGSAFSPHSQEYLNRVKKYIKQNKLKNVCYLNLNTQTFEKYN